MSDRNPFRDGPVILTCGILILAASALVIWKVPAREEPKLPPRYSSADLKALCSASWQVGFNAGERAIMDVTLYMTTNKDPESIRFIIARDMLIKAKSQDPYVKGIELTATNRAEPPHYNDTFH